MLVFEREIAGEGQREKETQNPKQAAGCELSAQTGGGAPTHEPQDHDQVEVRRFASQVP